MVRDPLLTQLRERPIGFVLRYVRRYLIGHAVILAAVVVAVAASVGSNYATKHLIDMVTGPFRGDRSLWLAFGLLVGVIAIDNLTWRIGGWVAARVFVAVTGNVRRDLFTHLMGHAPSYFADRLPGTLAGRISATANAIFQIESSCVWNVIPPALATVFAIATLFTVDVPMALALLLAGIAISAFVGWKAKKGTPLHRDYAEKAASVDGELVDIISNASLVRAFGALRRERRRLGAHIAGEMTSRRESLLYLEKLRLSHAVITAAMTAALLAWVLLLWRAGRASAGDIVLVCTLGFTVLHATRDLAVALVDLTQHVARLDEAIGALLTPHDMTDVEDAAPLRPKAFGVSFRDVDFGYPGRDATLSRLCLDIEAGTKVGLVGGSGAGKSTVLSLLQRFHDVSGGEIRIDGQNVAHVTRSSLNQMLSVVPQDVALLHRPVRENIRYGRPDATDAEVLRAAELASCRDLIEALPEGFDTMVGDRGVKLSGGQRQRLAIARAFLKNAPILLLDEATSALDSESEQIVQEGLERLMEGRTVIAVAHRLGTLKTFDRIVVMAEGRIVDSGSPSDLARRDGPYRDLLLKQSQPIEEIPLVAE